MRKSQVFFNSNKGAALAMTLIVLSVFTILLASMAFIFSSNLRMAKRQEENLKAYYVALSGIEAARATLLSPLTIEAGNEITMIDKIKANNITSFSDTLHLSDGSEADLSVTYNSTSKVITITSHAQLTSGGESELTLTLDVTGSSYSERWD